MLINKWLVADTVDNCKYNNDAIGYCLYLKQEPADIISLFKFTQEFSIENSFTVLLAGDDFIDLKPSDSYIEKIIGLFFQPSYYLFNYQPLLFLKNRTSACSDFFERLLQKSKDQGLRNILILEIQNLSSTDFTKTQHAYQVNREHINYDLIVNSWLTQYLEDKNPTEIHFLTPATEFKSSEVFNRIASEENLFKKT